MHRQTLATCEIFQWKHARLTDLKDEEAFVMPKILLKGFRSHEN